MSCCGGKCGCGAGCNCGSGCGGCKMYPDLSFSGERVSTETTIVGLGPEKTFFEGSEMGIAAENDCCGAGCKCGPNCGCGASCHCCK